MARLTHGVLCSGNIVFDIGVDICGVVTVDAPTLAEAGRFANALAAFSVQRIGAVDGLPSRADIQAWIHSARLRTEAPTPGR